MCLYKTVYLLTALQHINELTMKLDVLDVLRGAESIYLQLSQCRVSFPTSRPDHHTRLPDQDTRRTSSSSHPQLFFPQELPLKVQQVLGLYTPPSSGDQARLGVETQAFLEQPAGGDTAAAPVL